MKTSTRPQLLCRVTAEGWSHSRLVQEVNQFSPMGHMNGHDSQSDCPLEPLYSEKWLKEAGQEPMKLLQPEPGAGQLGLQEVEAELIVTTASDSRNQTEKQGSWLHRLQSERRAQPMACSAPPSLHASLGSPCHCLGPAPSQRR